MISYFFYKVENKIGRWTFWANLRRWNLNSCKFDCSAGQHLSTFSLSNILKWFFILIYIYIYIYNVDSFCMWESMYIFFEYWKISFLLTNANDKNYYQSKVILFIMYVSTQPLNHDGTSGQFLSGVQLVWTQNFPSDTNNLYIWALSDCPYLTVIIIIS